VSSGKACGISSAENLSLHFFSELRPFTQRIHLPAPSLAQVEALAPASSLHESGLNLSQFPLERCQSGNNESTTAIGTSGRLPSKRMIRDFVHEQTGWRCKPRISL